MTPGEARQAHITDYVLGLMEPAEAELFEGAMARDAQLAAEVAEWRALLAELDETAPRGDAGEGLWSRIAADVAKPPPLPVVPPAYRILWNNVRFWRATSIGAMVASLIFAFALIFAQPPTTRTEIVYVAVLVDEDGTRPGAIVEIGADGTARLIPLGRIDVPEGNALEVWTLPDEATGPVSIGLTESARRLPLDLGALPPTQAGQLYEITLEPETGSPTGRPTGPILFKGVALEAL